MLGFIVSFQRRSMLSAIKNRLLPVTRVNIILYLGIIFTALFVNIPTSAARYDQILGEDEIEYGVLHAQYPKLTFEQYMGIRIACYFYSHKNRVPVTFMCAIANNESGMSNTAVSPTGDYGYFQINAFHQYKGKNPIDLFDFSLNCKLAVNYYGQCYDAAIERVGLREISQSFRFYNAGMSSIKDNYNNWEYVINIMDDIQESTIALQEARDNIRLAANF